MLFNLFLRKSRQTKQETDSPLPSISERLAYLRPSRELLEFYRQKLAQFDAEHDDLLQLLEKCKSTAEDQVGLYSESSVKMCVHVAVSLHVPLTHV